MLRFSLAALLLMVLLAALSCAALMYASEIVKQAAVSLAVLTLLLATLWAVCGRGRRRAAAAGFALVGWAYLLLTNTSALSLQQHLLTADANRWLYSALHEQPGRKPGRQERMAMVDRLLTLNDVELFLLEQQKEEAILNIQSLAADNLRLHLQGTVPVATFNTIGHALWALWLGLLGALAAGTIYACSRRREPASSD